MSDKKVLVCTDNSYYLLKYSFDICLYSMFISLLKVSNLFTNGHFHIKPILVVNYVNVATAKVKQIPGLLV